MRVCVFGATGQIGSYLVEKELAEGSTVFAMTRRTSTGPLRNLHNALQSPHAKNLHLVPCDVTDAWSVMRALQEINPWAVYNLAAQSFVKASFNEPLHTTGATYAGAVNILEAARSLRFRIYQASSSEMYGSAHTCAGGPTGRADREQPFDIAGLPECHPFQDEQTPFLPNSPYAVAKLAAHNMVRIYRSSYDIHASAGIMFNTESPRRGKEFVTRKITNYVARLQRKESLLPLELGNVSAYRDWTHATDTVEAIYRVIRQDEPGDFCIGSGESHSVEEFLRLAFATINKDWREHTVINATAHLRPCEVPYLRASNSKAQRVLKWQPTITIGALVNNMVANEDANAAV